MTKNVHNSVNLAYIIVLLAHTVSHMPGKYDAMINCKKGVSVRFHLVLHLDILAYRQQLGIVYRY